MHWVLDLYERAELGAEVFEQVVALGAALDGRVAAGHADVVGDAHVWFLASADLDQGLVLRVDDVEHFLVVAV